MNRTCPYLVIVISAYNGCENRTNSNVIYAYTYKSSANKGNPDLTCTGHNCISEAIL